MMQGSDTTVRRVFLGLVFLLAIVSLPVLLVFYPWWKFDHLDDRIQRVITPAELQAWATNVLAEYPTYSPTQAHQLRTNFPAKIGSICRGGPGACWISVHLDPPPQYVMLIWSMKPSGDAVLELGPTNFVSRNSYAKEWAPGVYFHRR